MNKVLKPYLMKSGIATVFMFYLIALNLFLSPLIAAWLGAAGLLYYIGAAKVQGSDSDAGWKSYLMFWAWSDEPLLFRSAVALIVAGAVAAALALWTPL